MQVGSLANNQPSSAPTSKAATETAVPTSQPSSVPGVSKDAASIEHPPEPHADVPHVDLGHIEIPCAPPGKPTSEGPTASSADPKPQDPQPEDKLDHTLDQVAQGVALVAVGIEIFQAFKHKKKPPQTTSTPSAPVDSTPKPPGATSTPPVDCPPAPKPPVSQPPAPPQPKPPVDPTPQPPIDCTPPKKDPPKSEPPKSEPPKPPVKPVSSTPVKHSNGRTFATQGDPIVRTGDGLQFSLNKPGRYTSLKSASGDFVMQQEVGKTKDNRHYNVAFGFRLGTDTLAFDTANGTKMAVLKVNGKEVPLNGKAVTMTLPGGTKLSYDPRHNQIHLTSPQGDAVTVNRTFNKAGTHYLNVKAELSEKRPEGSVSGVLGTLDNDTNAKNDARMRDGSVFAGAIGDLWKTPEKFIDEWRSKTDENIL